MADGPPSSVDVGAGYGGGSGSSSSWEQSSGGYYNYVGVDPSTLFAPTFTRTDEVMACVRLSIGISSIVLGMYALNHFYRSRWILDIRTRSAYLVMFGAGCVVLSMLAAVNGATKDLWGVGFSWFWTSLLLFFVLPALFGSYICRALRLAAAFEDFSRKALCHESVLFLGEVSRYQNGDYATSTGASGSAAAYPSQFAMFSYITNTFIKAGSVEEVNISDMDKKRIIDLHHKGEKLFEEVGDEERRMVFGRAYFEVRQMLEANLLRRFLQTDRFKSVRMQRENVQAMMDSPQQAVEVV